MSKKEIVEMFNNIGQISCWKEKKGYRIKVENRTIHVPLATNFEWRCEHPIGVKHMYFGSDTGRYKDISFNVSFSVPHNVTIKAVGPRCDINLERYDVSADLDDIETG